MTQDFTTCPSCNKLMPTYTHRVPRATLNGRQICSSCEAKLLSLGGETKGKLETKNKTK